MAVDEIRPRHQPRRKDRKRWCGGHVGREHQPGPWVLVWETAASRVQKCSTCGKHLRYCGLWVSAKRGCACGHHKAA